MDCPVFQVDAFTGRLFSGNPAAVVLLDEWPDESLLQSIAAENNLAETAFIVPLDHSAIHWRIRWFTPAVEVPLCGHATLASAAVIRQEYSPSSWPITLESASGPLTVDVEENGFILDFPANPPSSARVPPGMAKALAADIDECLHADGFYLLTVADEQCVRALSPDFRGLAASTDDGVIITAAGQSADFVSRFFAPCLGIDEDPVTGAAHCVLTPYWAKRLGKTRLRARQLSQRSGDIDCELKVGRVLLRGRVVFYLRGSITV